MTLWNPLNVFSGRTHSAADGPSASFDPSRTGDPLGPRPTDPAIGLGGTQIGKPCQHGRSAPSSDRLRTAGRAGRRAALPHGDLLPAPPRDAARRCCPGFPGRRCAARLAEPPEQVGSVDVDQVDAVEELPVRRRAFRSSSVRSASAARSRPASRRLPPRRPPTMPTRSLSTRSSVTSEVNGSTDEWETPAAEVVAVSDEPEHEEQPEVVVEAVEPAENVAEAVISEDDADAAVPFYKRELSFRRKKAEVEAADQPELEAADETARSRSSSSPMPRPRSSPRSWPRFAAVDASDEPEAVVDEPVFAEAAAVEIAAVHELPEADDSRRGSARSRHRRRAGGRRSSFRSASRPATTPPITRGTRKTRRKSLSRSSLRSSTTVLPSRMPRMQATRRFCPQPSQPRL